MDLAKALNELRAQRDDLDDAILCLERLAAGRPRRRGRPLGRATGRAKKRTAATARKIPDRLNTAAQ